MTDGDLIKGIRSVVKEELEPIKDTLEGHGKKLDGITDQLVDVSEDVAKIKNKLESRTKRITTIEDHLGLPTPAE
ncbi:hypothetical protein A2W45_01580 [Candidatus Curtissbacteria bacterium RIFCSPHIGHO2_12_41_11]|uniref:Uncharacterized protein n=3 Tax=Candidatus Curtissiibacteriota TaxID=1752717 RepID=A0A1F5HT91_9BACT|nr:MAG: hypothetical protein UU56_C0001G0022 [Candidatus Curtissbacteria bacterium GW2011_GWA2_41_24]OGD90624.1 MAG: hypothetical protein A2Z54_01520 [Candidatus Curtissbacteria bacterium RIFCSPHIGHO2_02_39_8]OGD98062.1 MAG: hypothetical protein A2W45_01580 [Candidatus Curtissbacteria bacterium RIFCSPHIGHO2_12_41_11]OGE07313.1 MAG: hypothetical protein A2W70_00040 [Candidatus Curtissbacteria bacterium RIFCSPLOWO2_02_41_11]